VRPICALLEREGKRGGQQGALTVTSLGNGKKEDDHIPSRKRDRRISFTSERRDRLPSLGAD